MPLYIRDDSVDDLAAKLQKVSKAPSKTEAVRRALQNELKRTEEQIPLREKIRKLQDDVARRMGQVDPKFDMKAFTDEGWEI